MKVARIALFCFLVGAVLVHADEEEDHPEKPQTLGEQIAGWEKEFATQYDKMLLWGDVAKKMDELIKVDPTNLKEIVERCYLMRRVVVAAFILVNDATFKEAVEGRAKLKENVANDKIAFRYADVADFFLNVVKGKQFTPRMRKETAKFITNSRETYLDELSEVLQKDDYVVESAASAISVLWCIVGVIAVYLLDF